MKQNNMIYYILIAVAMTLIIPFIYVILLSFSGTGSNQIGEFTLDNYKLVLDKFDFIQMNLNSLFISFLSVSMSLCFSTLAAFAIAKIDIKINSKIAMFFFLGMFMPGQVLIVPVYNVLTQLNLIDVRLGLVLYYIGSSMAFAIFFFLSQLKSFPTQLIEAAQIEGAGWGVIYRRIVLPYLRPAIITLGIMNFIGYWNEMFYAMLVLQSPDKRTVTAQMVRLSKQFENNIPVLYAGLILGAIPIIILYIMTQDKINAGGSEGAVK